MCNVNTRRRRLGDGVAEETFGVIMIENFPKWKIDSKQQIQESGKALSRINTKTTISKDILVKLENQRQENLERSQREKTQYLQNKGKNSIRLHLREYENKKVEWNI